MMTMTYERALRAILRGSQGKGRGLVLAYFHEDEHGKVGRALDEMVVAGQIMFDGTFYRWNYAVETKRS